MLGYKTITRRVVYTSYEGPKPVFCGLLHRRHGAFTRLSGCNSREYRAQAALAQYQAAAAAGDLIASRIALLALVGAEDSNPDYWEQLGQGADPAGRFQRRLLRLLAGLTSWTGAIRSVARHPDPARADSAETWKPRRSMRTSWRCLQPDHPAMRLTYGYVALKRSNLDEADRQVDPLLARLSAGAEREPAEGAHPGCSRQSGTRPCGFSKRRLSGKPMMPERGRR